MKKIIIILSLGLCMFGINCNKNNVDKEKEVFASNYKYLDDVNHVFEKINYDEITSLINKDGKAIIYFGGSWCPNCQAVVSFINDIAKKMHIDTIYNFDTKIDFDGEVRDIRRCKNINDTDMWSKIINKIGYTSDKYVEIDGVKVKDSLGNFIPSMSVPTIVVINDGVIMSYVAREYFYNPDSLTLWDTKTFDGEDVTESFKTELVSLFTIYDGCTDDECSA